MPTENQSLLPDPNLPSSEATKWPDFVPEELRQEENKALAKFKEPKELFKSYPALERKMGTAVFIPPPGAAAEEVEKYRRKIGVPADAKEFGVELDDVGKRILPDYLVEAAKNAGIKYGVPKEGFQGLMNEVLETGKAKLKEMETQIAQLQQGYRKKFEDSSGAEKDTRRKMIEEQWKNDQDVDDTLKGIIKAFPILLDHPFVTGALELKAKAKGVTFPAGPSSGGSAAVSYSQLNALYEQARKEPAFQNVTHPEHRQAHQRVMNLAKELHDIEQQRSTG